MLGAIVATFVAPTVLKKYGRKRAVFFALFFLSSPGAFLQLFSPNLACLVVGRVINCECPSFQDSIMIQGLT
jgi:MFS family permease